jgi:hypothetical protein
MKGYGAISALDVFKFLLSLGMGGGALKQTSHLGLMSLSRLLCWRSTARAEGLLSAAAELPVSNALT